MTSSGQQSERNIIGGAASLCSACWGAGMGQQRLVKRNALADTGMPNILQN